MEILQEKKLKEEILYDINKENDKLKEKQIEEIENLTNPLDEIFEEIEEEEEKEKEKMTIDEEKKFMFDQRRLRDFRYIKFTKYPQFFHFAFFLHHNLEQELWDQKTDTSAKISFDYDKDLEVDIGGKLHSRNNVGAGNMFLGLRYNLYKEKLYNYLRYTVGDIRKIFYQINYLSRFDTLYEYSYKRKFDNDDLPIKYQAGQVEYFPDILIKNTMHPNFYNDKHYFQVTKLQLEKRNKITVGASLNNLGMGFKIAQKQAFNKTDAFRYIVKFDRYTMKVKYKVKHKITKTLRSEAEAEMNYWGYGMSIYRNRFLWKRSAGYFGFGFFWNMNALGIELFFKSGGINISMPWFLWNVDYDMEEIYDKTFRQSVGEIILYIILSTGVSYFYKKIIKRSIRIRTIDTKKLIMEEKLEEKRVVLRKMQDNYIKCAEKVSYYTNKHHKNELEKKEKGLLIHLALYGKFDNLLKFKREIELFIYRIKNAKKKNIVLNNDQSDMNVFLNEIKVKEFCMDIENELVDITLFIRNKITRKEGYFHSLIFFKEKSKSKIFGTYNPIFKSKEFPKILIIYEILGEINIALKMDSEIFQIPEDIQPIK